MDEYIPNSLNAVLGKFESEFLFLRSELKRQDEDRWKNHNIDAEHRKNVYVKLDAIRAVQDETNRQVKFLYDERERIKGGFAVLAAIASIGWACKELIQYFFSHGIK